MQWNRRKVVYDAILVAGVVLFIGTFMTLGALRNPPADAPAWINLRIKAFGTCAFVMLTIILMIGRWRDSPHASCRCSTTAAISAC